jgi:hypothetical protein
MTNHVKHADLLANSDSIANLECLDHDDLVVLATRTDYGGRLRLWCADCAVLGTTHT